MLAIVERADADADVPVLSVSFRTSERLAEDPLALATFAASSFIDLCSGEKCRVRQTLVYLRRCISKLTKTLSMLVSRVGVLLSSDASSLVASSA